VLRRLLCLVGLVVGISLIVVAPPAGATLSPECEGSATLFNDGKSFEINAKATGTQTIPRKADVVYRGSIDLPSGKEYTHQGSAKLKVLFTEIKLSTWEWQGDTSAVATDGTTSYDLDLPAGLLGGVKGTVTGGHTQGGITCKGNVDIQIDGSAVNAASVGAGALAAAGAAGLGMAARGKR